VIEKNTIYLAGLGKKPKKETPRLPVETPEGIDTSQFPKTTTQPGAISLTEIEILDLLSEGPIDGLVSGEYTYVGTLGQTGWSSATFHAYDIAPNSSVKWLRSVFWNDVPVVNSSNQYNFTDISVAFTPGLPNGSIIGRIQTNTTISRSLGERLRAGTDFSKVYRILNPICTAINVNIKVTALSSTNRSEGHEGDIDPTYVDYQIFQRPIFTNPTKTPIDFSFPVSDRIYGKVSYGYIRSKQITFQGGTFTNDPDFVGWEIKIVRQTPDSTNSNLRNITYVDSLTEIYGDTFTYPLSAIIAQRFSAEYFSQIPNRSFDAKLLKVKIPNNYNPITRSYTGEWDGGFLEDDDGNPILTWTDNPAWCFYDLLTNHRYGLGKFIAEDFIDKWTLYQIGQNCDVLVNDGFGGLEPRFTCNLLINSREEAYKVVNDMASIFRAMTYYAGGVIQTVQDIDKIPLTQFTNANIVNGEFNYSSSSRRVRHTVAIVRYNDKTNYYKPAIEYVEDMDGIRKYGVRQLEVTAFGCTSRGQALRVGRWALLSETLETESVSFTSGPEANLLRPGDIFNVYDQFRKGTRYGGRARTIFNETPATILLDDNIGTLDSSSNYSLSLLTPSFNYDTTQVTDLTSSDFSNIRRQQLQKKAFTSAQMSGVLCPDGNIRSQITFSDAFDTGNYAVTGNLIWMIEASGTNAATLSNPLYNNFDAYRVIRLNEKENNQIEVIGLEYNYQKFLGIESGLAFEDVEFSSIPGGPINLQLFLTKPTDHSKLINYTFVVLDTTSISNYAVFVKPGTDFIAGDIDTNTYLSSTLPTGTYSGSYVPSLNSRYYFRIYSVNALGNKSVTYASSNISVDGIDLLNDITISSLRLNSGDASINSAGTRFSQVFETDSPEFSWQAGIANITNIDGDIFYRLTIRQPSNSNIPSSHIYFEATGLSKSEVSSLTYRFEIEANRNAISNQNVHGPFRTFDVVVEAMTSDGSSSAGGNFVTNTDANYTNSNGYDILYVDNPRVSNLALTPYSTPWNQSMDFYTDQWITPDGDIKIYVSGNIPDDMVGGFCYVSVQDFNESQAKGLTNSNASIQKLEFNGVSNPITVPARITGSDIAYIAVSVYDSFDNALILKGVDVSTTLPLSNVVSISKRGSFSQNAFIFKAWSEVDVNYLNGSLGEWWKKSAGIANISTQVYDSIEATRGGGTLIWPRFGYVFTFDNPLLSNNYSVMTNADSIAVINKSINSFMITGLNGRFWFGVVHNGEF
jgi:hypothetical protein